MLLRTALVLLFLLSGCRKESHIRDAFSAATGAVQLPSGDVDLTAPLVIEGAHDLTIGGDTRLHMKFEGPAAIVIRGSRNVRLENFTIDGNRSQYDRRFGLPPFEEPMIRFNKNNGIIIQNSDGVQLTKLTLRNIVSYAILANGSRNVTIEEATVADSGSLDEKGRNNATGGILFEEGCEAFAVRKSKFRNIRGNGLWTHSFLKSPRNTNGEFAGNEFRYVGRDALQAGHAVAMKIEGNTGAFIGFPSAIIDMAHVAVPVAIDTAGNVENSIYRNNRFEEVNGKCIDLDGFHHGLVERNECVNPRPREAYPHSHFGMVLNNSNPNMESREIRILSNTMSGFRFGGLFLIGEGHLVKGNVFRNVNMAHCNDNPQGGCLYKPDEPDLLRSGIYLAQGADRPSPAKGITIEDNTIQGYGISKWCIVAAPGVKLEANTLTRNHCE